MSSRIRDTAFGVFLTPDGASYPDLLRQVGAAEKGGLELIGIQDHPYQPRLLDTFVLIADLLARTERVRIFPDVANLPLRPPAMLAKLAASLDVVSGGRFELRLTGRLGDGWVPSLSYASPSALVEMRHVVDQAAFNAGRDPASVRRVLNVTGAIVESPARELLVGSPQHWIDQLTELAATVGIDGFIFAPPSDAPGQIQRFASDVVPGVRAEIASRSAPR